jgi:hypothetical protein
MRWTGYIVQMREIKNACKTLVEKPKWWIFVNAFDEPLHSIKTGNLLTN